MNFKNKIIILVLLVIFCQSLDANYTSSAQDITTETTITTETVVDKKESNKSSIKSDKLKVKETPGINWGEMISKMFRALFLGIGAFLALIAFIAIKNKRKLNMNTLHETRENTSDFQDTKSQTNAVDTNLSSPSNDSTDNIKDVVYQFFKLNK